MTPGQSTTEVHPMSDPKEAAAPKPPATAAAAPPKSAPAPTTPAGQRIAAIDVGSNSIRLVVAEVLPAGGTRVRAKDRENTRLAAALAKTDRLDPKAADSTVTVLRNFLSIANGY